MALFQPGNPGRPKGTKGKRLVEITEIADRLGCNPVEILMRFAQGDWQGLGYSKGTKIVYTEAGAIEEDLITPSERIQAAKEAAQYMYPKKKSVEHITQSSLEGMTPQQKLDALKQMVQLMEKEVREIGPALTE